MQPIVGPRGRAGHHGRHPKKTRIWRR